MLGSRSVTVAPIVGLLLAHGGVAAFDALDAHAQPAPFSTCADINGPAFQRTGFGNAGTFALLAGDRIVISATPSSGGDPLTMVVQLGSVELNRTPTPGPLTFQASADGDYVLSWYIAEDAVADWTVRCTGVSPGCHALNGDPFQESGFGNAGVHTLRAGERIVVSAIAPGDVPLTLVLQLEDVVLSRTPTPGPLTFVAPSNGDYVVSWYVDEEEVADWTVGCNVPVPTATVPTTTTTTPTTPTTATSTLSAPASSATTCAGSSRPPGEATSALAPPPSTAAPTEETPPVGTELGLGSERPATSEPGAIDPATSVDESPPSTDPVATTDENAPPSDPPTTVNGPAGFAHRARARTGQLPCPTTSNATSPATEPSLPPQPSAPQPTGGVVSPGLGPSPSGSLPATGARPATPVMIAAGLLVTTGAMLCALIARHRCTQAV